MDPTGRPLMNVLNLDTRILETLTPKTPLPVIKEDVEGEKSVDKRIQDCLDQSGIFEMDLEDKSGN